MTKRECGECSLCCKLLPMKRDATPRREVAETLALMAICGVVDLNRIEGVTEDFDKPAGARCPHQRARRGCCTIYSTRPFGCRFWSCRWLNNEDTADLRRPDRAHYVVDMMPDFVVTEDDGRSAHVECVQIWLNPKDPDAWRRDTALLAYLERRGEEGKAALFRLDARRAFIRFPASMSASGQPVELPTAEGTTQHRGAVLIEGLQAARNSWSGGVA